MLRAELESVQLRPIFNNPSTAKWIGLPEGSDICKSTELVLEQDVKVIPGKFDVSHFIPQMCSIR